MKSRYPLALSFLALVLLPVAALAAPLSGTKTAHATDSIPAVTVSSSPNPSHPGQEVTLTATVSPDSASGAVTFRDGTDSLGTALLSAGVATMTTTALGVGEHALTAEYGGDSTYAAGVSPVSVHVVVRDSTTLELAASPSPSIAGQAVLLTASLSPATAGGSVEFRDGTTSLGSATLSGGVATLSVPALCGGTYALSARYAGDAEHDSSSSSALAHVVGPAPTTITVVSSPDTATVGQAVSFSAHVSNPVTACPLTGSVQFVIDGSPYGSPVALSGDSATLGGITDLAAGTHAVHATYAGDPSFEPSTSPAIVQAVELNSSHTQMSSNPNPSLLGQLVTLTATVEPNSASGAVTFRDGADLLGTATLVAGVATVTTAALGAGEHGLSANYAGDGVYGASASVQMAHAVLAPDSTTLALVSSPAPSVAGQAVLLTATVSPATAGGSVEFSNGVTSLGSATLSGGVATLSVPGLCGGTYSLAADYAGDAGHYASTSPAIVHVVDPAPTTLTVASSLEPATVGQAVSFTATVHDSAVACALDGTVQFVIDGLPFGAPVALTGDSARVSGITSLAAGQHDVHAVYGGNSSFQSSTSPAITQTIVVGASATALASSPNPSRFGHAVTLTASVSPDGATGAVIFRDGTDSLGTATLTAGVATLTTAALGVGEHSLTAQYGGDGALGASVSPALPHAVVPDSTTLVLSASPSPSAVGGAVLLSASVSPAGAGGSVEFRNGTTSLGSATLSGGVATLSVPGLCGGTYSLAADYAGDAGHDASTSPAIAHVVDPAPTAIAVVSSLEPSRPGQAVSFTASVTDSAGSACALTGSVQFAIDSVAYGSPVALGGGAATLGEITGLAPGAHAVRASYSGNSSFTASTSPAITQSVVMGTSSVALASAPNPSRLGHAVTLTATVTPDSATGAVTFHDGADTLGTATLSAGVASLATAALAVGEHALTASYAGDGVYGASVSAPSAHTVLPDSTALELSASPSPSVVGQAVLLTATMSPASAGGSVEFRDGAASLGSAELAGGVATLSVPGLCGGSDSLSAVYAGDAGHYASTSPALVHVVDPAPTAITVVSSLASTRLGQAVSFTANVTDSAAGACPLTGSVQFVIDSVAYGPPVALAGGAATVSGITTLAIGSHGVYATYTGNASFQGSTSPAITQDVETPRPTLVGVRDVLNDQGGKVKLLWNASYLDLAPYDSIATYWVLRCVPAAGAARARQAGAQLTRPGETPEPSPGAFVAVALQGTTYYWEYIASQPAFHVANYSYVAATTCDSIAGSNPRTAFMIMARTANGAQWWFSNPDSGYSVDNLAPHTPGSFTGAYAAGQTTLHWAKSPDVDLSQYLLYRGSSAAFVPAADNLVVARADTGYVDVTSAIYYYKLCAVDVHGNASAFASLLPSWTAGVEDGAPLAFALEGVRPNPTRGDPLSVAFTLAVAAPARLELLDVSGRRVAEREVGVLGAGRHAVSLASGPRLAPGLYLVRLTQGANVRVTRVAVLK